MYILYEGNQSVSPQMTVEVGIDCILNLASGVNISKSCRRKLLCCMIKQLEPRRAVGLDSGKGRRRRSNSK